MISAVAIDSLPSDCSYVDPTGMTLVGPGFFMVRDPGTGMRLLTRGGQFLFDNEGYWVSGNGFRLQGYTNASRTLIGDLATRSYAVEIDAAIENVTIDQYGQVSLRLSNDREVAAGQIVLGNPVTAEDLIPMSFNCYWTKSEMKMGTPGSEGFGSLLVGYAAEPVPPSIPARLVAVRAAGPAQPQGRITYTGIATDLAIHGPGFFLVRSTNTGEIFATRAGAFRESPEGFLTTYDGCRLQGEREHQPSDLQVGGNVRHPGMIDPPHTVTGWAFDWAGQLLLRQSDGTSLAGGKLTLMQLTQPEALLIHTNGLFRIPPTATPVSPARNDNQTPPSQVLQGALEISQMDENLNNQRLHLAFHAQGPVTQTGNKADIAIVGEGFFLLRRPEDGKLYATRAGAFNVDADGYLVSRPESMYPVTEIVPEWYYSGTAFDATIGGLRLQGYCEPGLNRVGDIRIDDAGRPATTSPKASLTGWTIDREGNINVQLSDGSCYVRGQVLLQQFADPYALKCLDDAARPTRIVYGNPETALPLPAMTTPGSAGMGDIQGEFLEIVVLDRRPVQLPTRGGPWFMVTGVPEGHCLIEASADLKTWNPYLVCDLDSFGCGEFSPVAELGFSARALVSEDTFPSVIEPIPMQLPPKAFFRVIELP